MKHTRIRELLLFAVVLFLAPVNLLSQPYVTIPFDLDEHYNIELEPGTTYYFETWTGVQGDPATFVIGFLDKDTVPIDYLDIKIDNSSIVATTTTVTIYNLQFQLSLNDKAPEPGTYDIVGILSGGFDKDNKVIGGVIRSNMSLTILGEGSGGGPMEPSGSIVGKWKMVSGTDDGMAITDFDVELDITEDSIGVLWKGRKVEPTRSYRLVDDKLLSNFSGGVTFPGFLGPDDVDFAGVAIGLGDVTVSFNNDTMTFSGMSGFNGASNDIVVINYVPVKDCSLLASVVSVDVECFGEGTGSATVSAENFAEPVAIEWSNGSTSSTIEDLSAGIYDVTVTDADGCDATEAIEILEPEPLLLTLDSVAGDQGDSSGFIGISIAGGTPPYGIEWTGPESFSSPDEDLIGIQVGQYSVVVTDQNGCQIGKDSINIEMTVATINQQHYNIQLYPNPSSGLVFLQNEDQLNVGPEVKVFDLMGRRVLDTRWDKHQIDLDILTNGTFIISFELDGHSVQKLVFLTR